MPNIWVISTKLYVSEKSSIPQDGSRFYFGRSIVPSHSKEAAINDLTLKLNDDFIDIEKIVDVVEYGSKAWNSAEDDDFETNESYLDALETGSIALGCFISELSMEAE